MIYFQSWLTVIEKEDYKIIVQDITGVGGRESKRFLRCFTTWCEGKSTLPFYRMPLTNFIFESYFIKINFELSINIPVTYIYTAKSLALRCTCIKVWWFSYAATTRIVSILTNQIFLVRGLSENYSFSQTRFFFFSFPLKPKA